VGQNLILRASVCRVGLDCSCRSITIGEIRRILRCLCSRVRPRRCLALLAKHRCNHRRFRAYLVTIWPGSPPNESRRNYRRAGHKQANKTRQTVGNATVNN
jgi:hypothetical protein